VIKPLQTFALIVTLVTAFGTSTQGQQQPQTALKVQIVISRFQGDKKVSSVPYVLSLNAGGGGAAKSSLRMGSNVPIPFTSTGPDGVTTTSVNYRSVGTNIDVTGLIIDDARFGLSINIEDSSVYAEGQLPGVPKPYDSTAFRTFAAVENVILRNGQSSEFTAATDKFTGEVVKVDVTLTVLK
jgi:type II secretory pathway component GspD/PulD (secretin)